MKQFFVGVSILGAVVGLGYLGITQFYKGFGPQPAPPAVAVAPARAPRPIPLAGNSEPNAGDAVDPFSRRGDSRPESPPNVYQDPSVEIGSADDRFAERGVENQINDARGPREAVAPPEQAAGEPRRLFADRAAENAPMDVYQSPEQVAPSRDRAVRKQSPFAVGPAAADEQPASLPQDNAAPRELPGASAGAMIVPSAEVVQNSAAGPDPTGPDPAGPDPAGLGPDPYAKPLAAEPRQDDSRGLGDPAANLFGPISNGENPAGADEARSVAASASMAGGVAEGLGRPGERQLEGSQAPSLTIEKQAPNEIQVGKPATFVIKVRNTGAVVAHDVEIHDDVPQGAQFVSANPPPSQSAGGKLVWSLGALKPGDETTVQAQFMPLTEGEIGSVATVHFHAAASARTRATRPALKLQVSLPPSVMIGQPLTMKIHLTNPGSGAATGVLLTENVPAELKHAAGPELEFEVGVLRPGESRDMELSLTAAQAGHVVNLLTAQADNNARAEDRTEFDVLAPGLKVGLTGPKRRYLERNATFTVSVSNPGTAAARDVELTATLPRGMKFVEANNMGQYDAATNTVFWSLEELPPQETGKVTVTAVPQQAGDLKVEVHGKAKQGLADAFEETVAVEGMAAILFELVDVHDPIEVNGQTTYEIHVINQGSKAATNVRIVALLPPEMRPLTADGPVKFGVDGQRVLFEPLAQLAPKADVTYSIKAQALRAGDSRVRVQLVSDEFRNPITKEESTHVYADE